MSKAFVIKALAAAAAVVLAAACSGDEPKMPTPIRAVEIVTVLENRPATLELLPRAGGRKRLLVDNTKALSDKIVKGQRIVIEYKAEVCDTSQTAIPIDLVGAGAIPWGDVTIDNIDNIRKLNPAQAEVLSTWQTEGWLNFQVLVLYDGSPRTFAVVADEATLDKDTLDCYIYNPGEAVSGNSVMSRTYGSFSLREVGSQADRKIRVKTLQ